MIALLKNLKSSKSGASAAEYALIIAIVGAAVIIGAGTLGTAFEGSMTTSAASMNP